MISGEPGLGEQVVSKAVEAGLKSQLDQVEKLDVSVDANPLEVIAGKVDSVSIEAEGMVMQKNLRVEALKMEVSSISIDPLRVAFGDVELEQPVEAATRVVLTEQDISRAFNSNFIHDKLRNLDVQVDEQRVTVDIQQVDFRIPSDGKIELNTQVSLPGTGETQQVSFTAEPRMQEGGEQISLENVQYTQGKELSPELTEALLNKASELLNLRDFELDGVSLRLKKLDLQQGRMTLQAEAHIEQIPSS